MTHGNTLRIIAAAAITALVAVVPVAVAQQPDSSSVQHVCNMATANFQGSYQSLDSPSDSPAARNTDGLGAMPGKGAGLANAAAHSPALSNCGVLTKTPEVSYAS